MANLLKPTNSLFNNIYANSKYPAPEVGMGATELLWTDRRAYTIVEVRGPKTIVVQQDDAKRADSYGMSDAQSYTYQPNPEGHKYVVTLRNNGRWVKQGETAKNGTAFLIGARKEYFDFSF